MNIVRVALDVPIDELFDYESGEIFPEQGALVVVPFRKSRVVGVVVEFGKAGRIAKERIKKVERILPVPPLGEDTLVLARFCSNYYRHPLGRVFGCLLPTALRRPSFGTREQSWEFSLTTVGRDLIATIVPPRAVAMRRLLTALHTHPVIDSEQARRLMPRAMSLLQGWVIRGWVEKRPATAARTATAGCGLVPQSSDAPPLTAEQNVAVEAVAQSLGRYSPWLLHGVTGSGKTEVYLQLVERALARNLQSLVLVPEINLTPQLEGRFRQRFPGAGLVSLHSGLPERERVERWERARAGAASVVLGTRLAVFTPLPRLGLIIVDEEHDASFKQQEGLRYSARDVAVFVARQRGVPVLMGSATPSLETCLNARKGRFGQLRLGTRPAAQAPALRIVDLGRDRPENGLSTPVLAALEERLRHSEQSLVFINRRGYAPVLLCSACGWSAQCPRCTARLTLHLRAGRLRCHYCGHEERIALQCPACGSHDLKGLGQGTQRIEEAIAVRFPRARVLRIDSDTTRRKGVFAEMRKSIHAEEVDVLVGTQMLAKGHDFPKLTLVAVIGADYGLFSSDFRATERLFAQLVQVAGRAGRAGLAGEVLVQTRFPQHPLYQALARHDYETFAEGLLEERRRAGFPPYVFQALLRAEAPAESAVLAFLGRAAEQARGFVEDITLYDPVPAPVARIAGRFRAQLLVQSASRPALQRFLSRWYPQLRTKGGSKVRWTLDVDPVEL